MTLHMQSFYIGVRRGLANMVEDGGQIKNAIR